MYWHVQIQKKNFRWGGGGGVRGINVIAGGGGGLFLVSAIKIY